jgi:hypothetical protein
MVLYAEVMVVVAPGFLCPRIFLGVRRVSCALFFGLGADYGGEHHSFVMMLQIE